MTVASSFGVCSEAQSLQRCGCHVDIREPSIAEKVSLCALGTLFGGLAVTFLSGSTFNPVLMIPAAVFGVISGTCFYGAFAERCVNHYCGDHEPPHVYVHGRSSPTVIVDDPPVIIHNRPSPVYVNRRPVVVNRSGPVVINTPRVPVGHRSRPIRTAPTPVYTPPVRTAPAPRAPVGRRDPVRTAPRTTHTAPTRRAPVRTAPAQVSTPAPRNNLPPRTAVGGRAPVGRRGG